MGTGDDADRLREKAKSFGALARMLTDSKLRSTYGTAARKRFEHEFTFEDDCARLCIVLETKLA